MTQGLQNSFLHDWRRRNTQASAPVRKCFCIDGTGHIIATPTTPTTHSPTHTPTHHTHTHTPHTHPHTHTTPLSDIFENLQVKKRGDFEKTHDTLPTFFSQNSHFLEGGGDLLWYGLYPCGCLQTKRCCVWVDCFRLFVDVILLFRVDRSLHEVSVMKIVNVLKTVNVSIFLKSSF